MNELKAPRVLSADEVDLLKKQRDLLLPATRITAIDDFAKWLFTTITVVGTLGAAFSNSAFKKLNGLGAVLFFLAIAATGVSLAVAVLLRCVETGEVNWNSLEDILEKGSAALNIKRRLAWIAGTCFALAILLAGISPLVSGDQSTETGPPGLPLSYSYGKDGLRVTAALKQSPGTIGEIKIFAQLPTGESLIGAHRAAADVKSVLHFDASSASLPQGTKGVKITVICDAKESKSQDLVLPIQPLNDKAIVATGPCFE
jgi:hypothetical protein